jgi:hypothetical protein
MIPSISHDAAKNKEKSSKTFHFHGIADKELLEPWEPNRRGLYP